MLMHYLVTNNYFLSTICTYEAEILDIIQIQYDMNMAIRENLKI
jgi:hypothetical protein